MTENNPILTAALDALADIQLVDNTWQQADAAKKEILTHVRDMAAAYDASIEALKEENSRMREALEVYAEPSNWSVNHDALSLALVIWNADVEHENGYDVARMTLEEISHEP